MIEEVLGYYNFDGLSPKLIRHNENMTYCVDNRYLLRIHKHKSGFSTTTLYDGIDRTKIYREELRFLQHLKCCGMNVQIPIENRNGDLVTVLHDGTPVTVLSWIEGRTIEKSDLTQELCHDIGEMAGKLHVAASSFIDAQLLRYDSALCNRIIMFLVELKNCYRISAEYCDTMIAALNVIGDNLQIAESEFVLLHSDLSLSNILITENGLVPIDFSLFGYSHPMMDIGGLFAYISDEKLRYFITEGYEEITGKKVDYKALDCLFALQVLLGIVMHYELWSEEDWFDTKLNGWCSKIFEPLVNGEVVIQNSET